VDEFKRFEETVLEELDEMHREEKQKLADLDLDYQINQSQ
jgi:hypothetical protein